jgi:hypothetical protein
MISDHSTNKILNASCDLLRTGHDDFHLTNWSSRPFKLSQNVHTVFIGCL